MLLCSRLASTSRTGPRALLWVSVKTSSSGLDCMVSLHTPDAVRFSVICVDAVVDPTLGKNITPERLARVALNKAALVSNNGLPVALETEKRLDGRHACCYPEYHDFTAVGAWNHIGVASMIFRLEENLRRAAAGDTDSCGLHREFWSNIIGRNCLRYAVYMVSTVHT